jgi:hypothetical protein
MNIPPEQVPPKVPLLAERLAALTVALLLILTALGNAWLMFGVGILGVAVGGLVFRRSLARSSVLMAIIAALVAFAVAVMMMWR